MRAHRFIPAFVHIPRHFPFKPEPGAKQADKGKGDPVGRLPAVFRPARVNGKIYFRVPSYDVEPVRPVRSRLEAQAAVGIDLEIEIMRRPSGPEEKFQAAVLPHRGEGPEILRPDLPFRGAHADIQVFAVMAHLAPRPDPGILRPHDFIDGDHGHAVPIRPARHRDNAVSLFSPVPAGPSVRRSGTHPISLQPTLIRESI